MSFRKDQYAIGRFDSYSAATHFARSEAMRRGCCCAVRSKGSKQFDVITYEEPPIKALFKLAVCAGLIEVHAHLDMLRRVCSELGTSPSGWTFASKHGLPAYQSALQPIFGLTAQFINALRLIEWQADAGLSEPLPLRLAERYVLTMGALLEEQHAVDPRLASVAVKHWKRLDDRSREHFVENEWVDVLVWLRDQQVQFHKNQWRAGWSAIWRQYARWRPLSSDDAEWEFTLGETVIGPWKIHPLDSALKLAHEAAQMKHCVASFADRCRAGEYRIFSVIDSITAAPVATIGIECEDGQWELDQVQGKCNQTPDENIFQLADSVARRYNATSKTGSRGPGRSEIRLRAA